MSRHIIRYGLPTTPDKVYDAWTSKDINKMVKAIQLKTNLIDRHFLLLTLAEETYQKRHNNKYKDLFISVVKQHLREFPDIAPALKKDLNGILPRVPSFPKFIKLMTELEQYEEAKICCELALKFELPDNTKTGFLGRLKKIQKKQNAC